MLDIQFDGNWLGVDVAFKSLPEAVRSSATWGQRKAAELLVKKVKNHINRQDLGWAPRSVKTHSGDPRTLVDEEAYYSAIRAWKTGNSYNAGVSANAYSARGISIAYYALLQELGTGDIPRRPLWEPSFREIGGNKGIKKIVVTSIYDKIKKLRAAGLEITLGRL